VIKLGNEILQILKEMQGSINHIGAKVDSLESRFDSLENRFDSLETRFDSLESRFDSLESRFDSLESKVDFLEVNQRESSKDVKEIKSKVEIIYDQTASLTEFKTEVNAKLNKLIDLENVTKDNCYEIARLRSIIRYQSPYILHLCGYDVRALN
jgi:chromosome segregation ATPase